MNRRAEWLSANAQRRYPFVENTILQLQDVTPIPIPDSAILDFRAVCYAVAGQHVYLQTVQVIGSGPKTFVFGFQAGSMDMFFSVTDAAAFPYTATASSTGMFTGTCVFGEGILELAGLAPALYYAMLTPEIEPALVVFQDRRRVDSVLGTKTGSVLVRGDIYVKEGYNCNVTLIKSSNVLQIDAIRGAGKGLPCNKPTGTQLKCTDVFLRINGLTADDNGNFVLAAGPGLTLTADPANNKLTYKSAKPNNETTCKETG